MTERGILEAVARVDLFISSALWRIVAMAVLGAVLLMAVIAVREWAYTYCDPYRVDYDRPGVDITSEGPEGEWGDWRE